MALNRPWAFWRRAQYFGGFFVFLVLVSSGIYFGFLRQDATCFDGRQNGSERGVDCGGVCSRVCELDVFPPQVQWAKSFRIADGRYNAVAYIQNINDHVGSPNVAYTLALYDNNGLITERSGTTVLPPDSVYPLFEGRIETGDRVPTRTVATLEDPDLWLTADVGREQFVIESRQLIDVDSMPRLRVAITNTALTEARDVEIVATIFDSLKNPLTSSRTVVQNFAARTTEDVMFTWPEPIAKTLRSCEVPTDVVLAIDLSGSMNNDGGTPPQPVTSVLRAAEAFIDRLGAKDRVSVVTYATDAVLKQELTENKDIARSIVSSLMIAAKDETGSTNTGEALAVAGSEFTSSRHNQNARKVLVLLTDGLANAPGADPEKYAFDAAAVLQSDDVEIFAIGLGDEVNDAFLEGVATDGQHVLKVASSDAVDRIYRSVTEAICEEGPAVIEVIPKTATNFTPLERP